MPATGSIDRDGDGVAELRGENRIRFVQPDSDDGVQFTNAKMAAWREAGVFESALELIECFGDDSLNARFFAHRVSR